MKHKQTGNSVFEPTVAPFTGAWIETIRARKGTPITSVAPFTGAWIETRDTTARRNNRRRSHPSRVRGLKHTGLTKDMKEAMSHPSRVRGLKQAAMRASLLIF